MRLAPSAFVLALCAGCLASACGEAPPPKTARAAPQPEASAKAAATAAVPRTTSLRRSQVKASIARGLGYFLQNVTVDDYPVMRSNKFHGFRIRSINAGLGVELQPGDVITRVNGMPIEHPEEADAAMRALDTAAALRVDYERDGKAKTLELPIADD